MWENANNEDGMFEGTPIGKWKEVVFNASRGLAESELERLLEELALYEMAFEDSDIDINLRELFYKAHHDESFKQRLQERKNSIAIESMSKILSENE